MSVLIALAVLLELAAGTGLAIVAGVSRVQQVLAHFDWAWLPVLGGCLGLAFTGYYFAYRGVFAVEDGPLPSAGAGVLTAALPAAIWCCGAPFALALVGVFAYRVLAFWLPMPVPLAPLPALRKVNTATRGKERVHG